MLEMKVLIRINTIGMITKKIDLGDLSETEI